MLFLGMLKQDKHMQNKIIMKNILAFIFLCLAVSAFAQDNKKDTASFDYGARVYDARISRAMSVDPKATQGNNPYNFNNNQDTLQQDTINTVTFESLLDSTNMIFEPPKNYIEIEPIENRQMNYEKAYKHPTERFEVRYAIRKHDFGFYKQIFEMTVLNISGGQLPEYTPFGTEAVKTEFGADAGATVMVTVGEEFGQNYKYCLLVYILKNNIGDGYIFYLADDNKTITNLMNPINLKSNTFPFGKKLFIFIPAFFQCFTFIGEVINRYTIIVVF